MQIAVVHNAVEPDSRADEQDVLVQAAAVSDAIIESGHSPTQKACTLDLIQIKNLLQSMNTGLVFNLVESLDGEGRLIHLFPALLDGLGIPYTGSCTETVFITSHKILAKERMVLAGIPTPMWRGPFPQDFPSIGKTPLVEEGTVWLVKSLWEHGSLGLGHDDLISDISLSDLDRIMEERAPGLGRACFAEAYITGREFNLSLLSGPAGPEVLPPAEIIFEGYGPEKLPIVGYQAKWDMDSYEYHHTPRRFDFFDSDGALLEKLKSIAIQCWDLFGLNGYARVDFRVDKDGAPWVLEVNCNPCLSPDAGFAAAVSQAGLTYRQAIERIIGAVRI
ncbi:MAG: D-alanine--D-alanine ligase [Deltaproteobacteria bacterium]|nr:D-alanine--D-alanine ligase [Deltaproteobacteria bacterium]